MSRATVFRVENHHGSGPYTTLTNNQIDAALLTVDGEVATKEPPRPPPWADMLDSVESTAEQWHVEKHSVVFGFPSLSLLAHWFQPVNRRKLHGLGFRVAVYECTRDRIKVGIYQCCFSLQDAQRMATLPLYEVLAHEH